MRALKSNAYLFDYNIRRQYKTKQSDFWKIRYHEAPTEY